MAVKYRRTTDDKSINFLSRLRDGEPTSNSIIKLFTFLSRLRGGEPENVSSIASSIFLSRLRGGEHYIVC